MNIFTCPSPGKKKVGGGALLRLALMAAVGLSLAASAPATVKLPQLFSDHMVLQRDVAVPVWGWADPGERVTVRIADQSQAATADAGGKWAVKLEPLHVGAPLTLTVKGKNTLTMSDVLVGEVWLCSGQSNMDMRVARGARYWCGVNNEAEEVARAKRQILRETGRHWRDHAGKDPGPE